jgi:predicted lipoprotein with Yx(FWY)xxD motif
MRVRRIALLLVALLLVAACGGDEEAAGDGGGTSEVAAEASEPAAEPSEPAPSSEPAEDASAAGGGAIEVSSTDLGDVLVDGEGMTLYVFDNDTDGTSACTGDCAANWPPLTGEVTAGEGVDDSLLGTTERDDGSMQVTYADHPLYYFAGDQAAGDVNGQAVGGIWWVVGADGEKITEEVSQTTTSDGNGY